MEISKRKLMQIIELVKSNPKVDVEMLLDIAGVNVSEEGNNSVVDEFEGFSGPFGDIPRPKIRIPDLPELKDIKWPVMKDLNSFGITPDVEFEILEDEKKEKEDPYRDARGKARRYKKDEIDFLVDYLEEYKEVKLVPQVIINELAKYMNRTPDAIKTKMYSIDAIRGGFNE